MPLMGGRKVTITNARAEIGYPVPLPATSAARQANLTEVWVNSQHDIALIFGDGKVLITMAPATYSDAAARFQTFIIQNRDAKVAMGRVHGRPALVISPHTDPHKSNPAWVEFDSNGIDINISSHSYGPSTLLAIANSM